jgi:hypothetical protein
VRRAANWVKVTVMGLQRLQALWLCRAIRGLWPDRNPLRRRTDRLEVYLLGGLLAAAVAGTPFAVRVATHDAYLSALHTRQEQLATVHQVAAVLTAPASAPNGYSVGSSVLAQASWTSANDVHHAGLVPVVPGSPRGTSVTVWTDPSGNLASPPLTVAEVNGQADAARAAAIIVIVVAYGTGAAATRQLLNRRRMAAWDEDWLVTARSWNHHQS